MLASDKIVKMIVFYDYFRITFAVTCESLLDYGNHVLAVVEVQIPAFYEILAPYFSSGEHPRWTSTICVI